MKSESWASRLALVLRSCSKSLASSVIFWETKWFCFSPCFSISNTSSSLISQPFLAIRMTSFLFIVANNLGNMLLLSLQIAGNNSFAFSCTFWYFGTSFSSGLNLHVLTCFHNSWRFMKPETKIALTKIWRVAPFTRGKTSKANQLSLSGLHYSQLVMAVPNNRGFVKV